MTDQDPCQKLSRTLIHERTIALKVYRREDALWDIEASIKDCKAKDFQLAASMRKLGEPIHDMLLTITINPKMDILEASAQSMAVPYWGSCELIGPSYAKLVGLNLLHGFREGVKSRLGGVLGCTHISELTKLLPTVATQAFIGEVVFAHKDASEQTHDSEQLPFQYNGCHALRTDGEVVKKYHAKWYGYPITPGKFII